MTIYNTITPAKADGPRPAVVGTALVAFRDAVAADVAAQYPRIDYVAAVVSAAIERHAPRLGWTWYVDGPQPTAPALAEARLYNAAVCQQILDAINILDGNDDPIDWRDLSQPELLRKLCEHLEAFDMRRGLHTSNASRDRSADVGNDGGKRMLTLRRLRYRILHWLIGGHTNKGSPVRDVEHCDLCNDHPEPMDGDEGC